MASAMFCPCETRTSTCRNFATISSGLCCFLGILVLLDAKRHTSGRTTSKGEDQHHAEVLERVLGCDAVLGTDVEQLLCCSKSRHEPFTSEDRVTWLPRLTHLL